MASSCKYGEKSRKALRTKVLGGGYLAFLSIKHEVDPDKLFYALISAGENSARAKKKQSDQRFHENRHDSQTSR
jgi:hypothetical protein